MTRVRKSARVKANLEVPSLSENTTERKRVLNVLAQRRYRQRKKDELVDLKKRASADASPNSQRSLNIHKPEQQFMDENIDELALELLNDQTDIFHIPDSATDMSYYMTSLPDLQLQSTAYPQPDVIDKREVTLQTSNESSTAVTSFSTPTSMDSFSFPDEAYLPVLELKLLRGCMAIAKRLKLDAVVWNLHATSPFTETSQLDFHHLPLNLQPTFTQMTVKHHPAFDLMPWPSVRDKLILIFSQPPDLRPPMASSPTAFVDFVYDMEDSAEGFRIWGDDPYVSEAWEVGQKVFERWWWLFDSQIIRQSNAMREHRGATILGSVIGEIP